MSKPIRRFLVFAALAVPGVVAVAAALPAARTAVAQSPLRCSDPFGAIEGTVHLSDGSGAAGAHVDAVVLAASGEIAVMGTVADADGAYRLERLCPGKFLVRAALMTTVGPLVGSHDADGDGQPDDVRLDANAPTATDIDITLGSLPQTPPTAVPNPNPSVPTRVPAPACTVTDGTIRGTVRDTRGNLVEGAAIHFRGRTAIGAVAQPVYSAADGTYALVDLCEGAYFIAASKVLADGTTLAGSHPDPVEVTPDARSHEGVDIVLAISPQRATAAPPTAPPPPTAIPGPSTACRLVGSAAGTVATATGAGVEGATIQLVGQTAIGSAGGMVTTTSGRGGAWLAPRVCAGEYTVLATKISAAQALVGVLDADGDARPDVVRIDANTPAPTGLDIVMRDVLAPAPSPFWRRGMWPSAVEAR